VAQPLGWRFAKLWTASTTSALGRGLATIAAPLFVAAHTRSPLNAATYAASTVLVGLVAGTYRASSRTGADGDRGTRQQRSVRAELAEGFRWLAHQRVLRTMTLLIGLLNLTLTAATAVLVLLVKEQLHLGAVAQAYAPDASAA
jgi:hypothetical protein